MPGTYKYPGVYVEELPSSVRSIIGVGTSITAFIGRAIKGPVNKAVLIHNFSDYQRIFGGLWAKSNMSYAVYQYFQNGGVDAIIVRVTNSATPAKFSLTEPDTDSADLAGELVFAASDPGLWGEGLQIEVSDATEFNADKENGEYFNVAVYQKGDDLDKPGPLLELFRNVSLDSADPRYIGNLLVNGVSTYLRLVTAKTTGNPSVFGIYTATSGTANDGETLQNNDVIGNENEKTGMYALKDADLFNLLCIPAFGTESSNGDMRSPVYEDALAFCNARRAILIIDPPAGDMKKWGSATAALEGINDSYVTRDKNGAIFFPRIMAPDPLEEYRLKEFDPCGAVAGVIARTDAQRGVWKAPAGIEAVLMGVPDLSVRLTNEDNGELNPKGINCLRILPDAGRVIWGSRTLRGADSLADQWKYLPVRRTALFIEETLFRGTQWAVFEPNDERLWSQLRLNIGAFMHSLFVKGAFQGSDPKQAYLVKCDSETTTQTDIDAGIVNILVGFAPLKPAEFVILKIQQLAGQEE